ncbi:MAG: zinc transporter [Georgenia sp.]
MEIEYDCVRFTLVNADEHLYLQDFSGCGPTANRPENFGGQLVTILPPDAGEPDVAPIVLTAEDVQHLIVAPGGLQVQPDREWVLVNIDTIVWTTAAEQTFDLTVLDTPVAVRMTPVDFTWDFGDGSPPVTTTDPGAPWPDHTVGHTYTQAQDAAQVTLTTRWAGVFDVAGAGVWQPVQGLATTTEVSDPFEVATATPSLVAAP